MSDTYNGIIRVGERVGCKPDPDTDTPARFGLLEEIWIEAGLAWARVQFDGGGEAVLKQ